MHGVRQVARLRAGALHHAGVFAEHVVELADQRLHFLRKAALQRVGLAPAHGGQALAQQVQRAQRQMQLHGHGGGQPGGQRAQGDEQQAGKALQRLGHQGVVGRHGQAQRGRFVFGQLQDAGERQQLPALPVLQPRGGKAASAAAQAAARAVLGRWRRGRGRGGQGQGLVPQRARTGGGRLGHGKSAIATGLEPVDLPIHARKRARQARIARLGRKRDAAAGREIDGRRELVQLHRQLRLPLRGDVFLKQIAQPPAGQRQRQRNPRQRARQQPRAQGTQPAAASG